LEHFSFTMTTPPAILRVLIRVGVEADVEPCCIRPGVRDLNHELAVARADREE
jgi:hypothetical protein